MLRLKNSRMKEWSEIIVVTGTGCKGSTSTRRKDLIFFRYEIAHGPERLTVVIKGIKELPEFLDSDNVYDLLFKKNRNSNKFDSERKGKYEWKQRCSKRTKINFLVNKIHFYFFSSRKLFLFSFVDLFFYWHHFSSFSFFFFFQKSTKIKNELKTKRKPIQALWKQNEILNIVGRKVVE